MKNLIHIDEIMAHLSPVAEQTGYSIQMLQWGFERLLEQWHEAAILAFLHQELPELTPKQAQMLIDADLELEKRQAIWDEAGLKWKKRQPNGQEQTPSLPSVMLVSASTVPSASFQDVILMLLLPIQVVQRPASDLAGLFEALHAYVKQYAPKLAERWTILPSSHDDEWLISELPKHDWVNVCGSDTAIAHYRTCIQHLDENHQPTFIAHGHRLSCAFITAQDALTMTPEEWNALALDVSVWDQVGCLSPKCLFVEHSSQDVLDIIVSKLLHALDLTASLLPEIPPNISDLAAKNSALRMAQIEGANIKRAQINHDVLIDWPEDTAFAPVLLPRVLNIYKVPSFEQAVSLLSPCGQALGTRNHISPEMKQCAQSAGFNYFCKFGEMQNPPITWIHDGMGTYAGMLEKKT